MTGGRRDDPGNFHGKHVSHVGRCQGCGKYAYVTRADAKAASRRALGQGHMGVYPCPHNDGWWHYGHIPAAVKHGDMDKADFEDRTRARLRVRSQFVGAPVVVTIPNPRDAACVVDALDAAADVLAQIGNHKAAARYAGLRDRFADELDKAAVPPCNDGRAS